MPAAPGGAVTVKIIAQSPGGLALSYSWAVSPSAWMVASGGSTDTVTLTAPATYSASGGATVTVTDSNGAVATGFISLGTIGNGSPALSTVSASSNPVINGRSFTVRAIASDPNGDSLTYTWALPAGYVLESGQGTSQITAKATNFSRGEISVSVTDGNGGSQQGSLYVSARDGEWTYLQSLEIGVYAGIGAELGMDASGNAIAIGGRYPWPLGATRYDAVARQWSAATAVSTASGYVCWEPRVAVDANGNAIAVWCQFDGVSESIFASRYVASADAWLVPQALESSSFKAAQPEIVMDNSGNAWVVWPQSRSGSTTTADYDVMATRYDRVANTWSPAAGINAGGGSSHDVKVAADRQGNAIAVWRQLSGARIDMWANRYSTLSGSWGTPTLVETNDTDDVSAPDIAMDAAGNAFAVWLQPNNLPMTSRFNVATGTWSNPEVLFPTGGPIGIVMDAAGNAIASTMEAGGVVTTRRYSAVGGAWQEERMHGAGGPIRTITMNAETGNALLVWDIGSEPHGYSYYFAALDTWTTPRFDLVFSVGGTLSAAINADGSVVAVGGLYGLMFD